MQQWDVEDKDFWLTTGKKIAIRNLIISSITLCFAFIVWVKWSVFVLYLKDVRPEFSNSDLYWLTALPLLSAAFLRIPYSFVVPWVGGARWNIYSLGFLLLPILMTYFCLKLNLSIAWFYISAFLTGFSGANFASSCANISYIFPYRLKSIALGINSAIGNLGVGIGQGLIPFLASSPSLLISFSNEDASLPKLSQIEKIPVYLGVTCIMMICLSFLFMNNIQIKTIKFERQIDVLKDLKCWDMCLFYTATFGAYIGLAAIFPFFMAHYFGAENAANYAFIGATISALLRPAGHVISKYFGAVNMTFFSLLAVILGCVGVILSLSPGVKSPHYNFELFLISYYTLFMATGLGKGTSTALIPEVYTAMCLKIGLKMEDASHDTSSVIGFSSAIATFGAFFLPGIFDISERFIGNSYYGFYFFIVFITIILVYLSLKYMRKSDNNPLYAELHDGQSIILDRPSRLEWYARRIEKIE